MTLAMFAMFVIVTSMDVLVLATLILQWDMLGIPPHAQLADISDSCIPYNTTQTLWRVINDFDMVARLPFTPCTLFNGGAGDSDHILMAKGVVKVCILLSILILASIVVGLLCRWHRN
jgi:hypothetical protein